MRSRFVASYSLPSASNTGMPDAADIAPFAGVTSPSSSDSEQHTSTPHAPNVYINGLPPHFSEQELFALARPFGEVKSVRTFTRHVSEKPTGYGFVLFDDIESAEKCIEGLRKYRNLHPSFSKQVHRIPGTIYAQQSIAQPTEQDPTSFKARMEKLKDESSTNLYMEGLPLSIDDETLASLVAPYKIKSSRFFKTKLSDPPRIIAFVRLETRTAAEDTIERLHGRLVRGWNDPGCRISVRFADSAEQRELRRTERVLKGGDHSPSRLTIAQAALLNLRGQEMQADSHKASNFSQREDIHPADRRGTTPSLRQCQGPLDYLSGSGPLSTSVSLPVNLGHGQYDPPILPVRNPHTSAEINSLMQSIQSVGIRDGLLTNVLGNATLSIDYPAVSQIPLQTFANGSLLSGAPPVVPGHPRGQTQARNGFTPAEEVILQAHSRRLQLQTQLTNKSQVPEQDVLHTDSSTPIGQGFIRNQLLPQNGGRLSAASTQIPLGRLRTTKSSQDFLPTISEDDSHVMGESWHESESKLIVQNSFRGYLPTRGVGLKLAKPANCDIMVTSPLFPDDKAKCAREYQQSGTAPIATDRAAPCASVPCVRLPVLSRPPTLTGSDSQSCPSAISSNSTITSITSLSSTRSDNGYSQDSTQTRRMNVDRDSGGDRKHTGFGARTDASGVSPRIDDTSTTNELKSPPVVSPALTFSSRTPSTLSPATPFVGSLGCAHDPYEHVTVDCEDGVDKDWKINPQLRP
ncbi:hypothetical protein J3A83DRAFT_2533416 [Scleroderma citrinum]